MIIEGVVLQPQRHGNLAHGPSFGQPDGDAALRRRQLQDRGHHSVIDAGRAARLDQQHQRGDSRRPEVRLPDGALWDRPGDGYPVGRQAARLSFSVRHFDTLRVAAVAG